MALPSRNRPYLERHRPLAQASTATRAMAAVTGDEDQPALVRPYTTDPELRRERRAHNLVGVVATDQALLLLGLIAQVQDQDRREDV